VNDMLNLSHPVSSRYYLHDRRLRCRPNTGHRRWGDSAGWRPAWDGNDHGRSNRL